MLTLLSKLRGEFATVLIVTTVTVLIWFWAAGETLDKRPFTVQLRLVLPENWVVDKPAHPVTFTAEGSKLALQNAEQALRRPLRVDLPTVLGPHSLDVADLLRRSPEIEATGLKISTPEPTAIDVTIDEIRRVPARVREILPGVVLDGEVEIEPAEVIMTMPGSLRNRLPADAFVEAYVDPSRLAQLRADVRQSIEVKPRLPEGLLPSEGVTIEPATVRLSFTMRSRIRELRLDNVRIHLAGPPEDHKEYLVELEQTVLRDVTISADSDLIRRIEAGEATVVAVLYLSSREKEQRIESKPITYFVALGTRAEFVQARVGDSAELPRIRVGITRLASPAP